MADFLTAYKKTMGIEGLYANDPDDTGGETWKGVARKKNPLWKGWAIVDYYKDKPNLVKNLQNDQELEKMVQEFYQQQYWNAVYGDKIESQEIANSIFDSAVNMGVKTAIKLVQRTLEITENGSISAFLINKLNNNENIA